MSATGIEILPETEQEGEVLEVSETVLENGVLVLASTGVKANIASAVRDERDELADRAIPR